MTNKIQITTYWGWNQNQLGVAVKAISGGKIPSSISNQIGHEISSEIRIPNESQLWRQANSLIEQVTSHIPEPEPIELGNYRGTITAIVQATCELNRDIHINL